MKRYKKGFTLIEIIVVLVIVAILALLIIVAINKYVQRGKDEYNAQLEEQLKLVGKDYYTTNPDDLPVVVGKRVKPLWLAYLKSNNYTSEEFVDADGGRCIKSYVQVEKTDGGYEYTPCLVCDNYKSRYAKCTVDVNEFDITNDGVVNEPESDPPKCSIELKNYSGNWTNKDVVAKIKYEADEVNGRVISGLSVDGKEVVLGTSGNEYPYTITQSGYNKKVSAVSRDDLGLESDICYSKHEVKIDKGAPVCVFSDPYMGDASWKTNGYPGRGETVYYDLTCSDSESKNIVTEQSTVVSNVSINNEISLTNVRGASAKESDATNGKVYKLKVTAGEEGLGSLKLASGVVKDVAGNSASAVESPAVFVWNPTTGGGGGELPTVDTSAPRCDIVMTKANGSIYNEGEWSNQNVTVTATCTPTSDIKYSPSQTVTSEGTTTVTITATNVFDKEKKSKTVETRTIKIDKTPPTCTVTMKHENNATYKNDTWTNKDVIVSLDCSDTTSGLKKKEFTSNDSGLLYNKEHKVDIEGENSINFYAVDNAENEYKVSKIVKLDKTPPKLDSLPCYNGKKSGFMQYKYPWTDAGSGLGKIKSKHCYTSIPSKYNSSWSCAYQSIAERSWDNRSGQFTVGNRIDSIYMDYKALPNSSNKESIVNTKWYVCDRLDNCKETGVYIDKLNYSDGKYSSSNRNKCSGSVDLTTYTRKVCTRKKTTTYAWSYSDAKSGGSQGPVSKKTAEEWCKSKGYTASYKSCGNQCGSSAVGKTCRESSGGNGNKVTCSISICNATDVYTDWSCVVTTGHTVCTSKNDDLETVTCTEE